MEEVLSELILYDDKFERIYAGFMHNARRELGREYDRDTDLCSLAPTDIVDSSGYSFGSIINNATKVAFGKNKKFIVAHITPKEAPFPYSYGKGVLFYTRRGEENLRWLRVPVPRNFFENDQAIYSFISIHLSDTDFLCMRPHYETSRLRVYNLSDSTWHVFTIPATARVGSLKEIVPLPGTDELLLLFCSERNGTYVVRYDLRQQKPVSDMGYIPCLVSSGSIFSPHSTFKCLPIRHNDDFFLIISDKRDTYLYSLSTGSIESIHCDSKQILFDSMTNTLFSVTEKESWQEINVVRCYLDQPTHKLGDTSSVLYIPRETKAPSIFNIISLVPGRWLVSVLGCGSNHYRIVLPYHTTNNKSPRYATVVLSQKIHPTGTAVYFLNNEMTSIARSISRSAATRNIPSRHLFLIDGEDMFSNYINTWLLGEHISRTFKNRVLDVVKGTNYSVQELTKGWKDTSAVFLGYDYASRVRSTVQFKE